MSMVTIMRTRFLNFIKTLSIATPCLVLNISQAQIWTGTNQIGLDSNTQLVMPNRVDPACRVAGRSPDIDCSPTTRLNLLHKGKTYSYKKLIEPWEGSFFIYFVKLSQSSYARDLNGDGLKEIAIYPAVCGNSPKSLAYIYTVKKNQLLPYGTGIYFWETGIPVTGIKMDPKFKPDI